MAITVNQKRILYRSVDASVSGDETIFRLLPKRNYSFSAVNTSAGTATLKTSVDQSVPTDFSEFITQTDASGLTTSFAFNVTGGQNWIGLDIDSGTWDIKLQEIAA